MEPWGTKLKGFKWLKQYIKSSLSHFCQCASDHPPLCRCWHQCLRLPTPGLDTGSLKTWIRISLTSRFQSKVWHAGLILGVPSESILHYELHLLWEDSRAEEEERRESFNESLKDWFALLWISANYYTVFEWDGLPMTDDYERLWKKEKRSEKTLFQDEIKLVTCSQILRVHDIKKFENWYAVTDSSENGFRDQPQVK